MEILVKSGGFSPEKDYSWASSASPDGGHCIDDGLLGEFGVSDLFDDRSPSVVLARRKGVLLLLVARLESSRTDYRGRHIRNMVAWRCREDEEAELRGLTVLALESPATIEKEADEAVTRDDASPSGFKVDWGRLRSIRGPSVGPVRAREGLDACRLARNSKERQADLAKALKSGTVPIHDGPLVVVTSNVHPERLEAKGVWRGLSSLVPSEDWVTPGKKKTHRPVSTSRALLWTFVMCLSLASVGVGIWATGWLTRSSARKPPQVTGLVLRENALQEDAKGHWSPGAGERWTIARPKGTATMTVAFDQPMDTTTAPSISWSPESVTVASVSWSADGTSCSFQVTFPRDDRPCVLRVSGARDRSGNQMQPLELTVVLDAR